MKITRTICKGSMIKCGIFLASILFHIKKVKYKKKYKFYNKFHSKILAPNTG